jgi:ribonuclease-3
VRRARKATELEIALGYTFKSRDLIEHALTHASARSSRGTGQDNERLEFLGDRVLGLAIAELLVETDPDASEGTLARRFNRLVNGTTCARIARSIGVGARLVLSSSEIESGGRDKETILADALEALLAAVFLESGFKSAREIVRSLWASELAQLPVTTVDAKSALQEWAQGQGLALPQYTSVERSGPDHAPHFVCEVKITGRQPARGEGASKRASEQAAATALLAREGVWKGLNNG